MRGLTGRCVLQGRGPGRRIGATGGYRTARRGADCGGVAVFGGGCSRRHHGRDRADLRSRRQRSGMTDAKRRSPALPGSVQDGPMERTDATWTAIRDALPTAEELAEAVAAELRRAARDVRARRVLIGTGSDDHGPARRTRSPRPSRPSGRGCARPRPAHGRRPCSTRRRWRTCWPNGARSTARHRSTSSDRRRSSGRRRDRGPRQTERLVLFLAPLRRRSGGSRGSAASARCGPGGSTQDAVADFAPLHHAVERADVPRRDRRLPGRRARHRGPRRRGPPGRAPGAPRGRRRATPRRPPACDASPPATAWTPTGSTASSRSRRARRPTRCRSGRASATRSSRCSRAGSATSLGSTAPGAEGVGRRDPAAGGAAAPRPDRGARPSTTGRGSRASPPSSTASSVASRPPRLRRRAGASTEPAVAPQAWVAVGSDAVDGVAALAPTYADLVDATRTAPTARPAGLDPGPGAARRRAAAARRPGARRRRGPPGARPAARGRAHGRRARRDAPGVLRRGREHARDGAPAPPRDPDGRLPAREDRGAPRRADRRPRRGAGCRSRSWCSDSATPRSSRAGSRLLDCCNGSRPGVPGVPLVADGRVPRCLDDTRRKHQ